MVSPKQPVLRRRKASQEAGTGCTFAQGRKEGQEDLSGWSERERDWPGHPGHTLEGPVAPQKGLRFTPQAVSR